MKRLVIAILLMLVSRTAWANITVIGATSTTCGTNVNCTVATPANTQSGDLLLAWASYYPYQLSLTAPVGWTLKLATSRLANGNPQQQLNLYYLQLATAPSGSYTWTFSNTAYSVIGIIALRGAKAGDPFDVTSANTGDANASMTATSITTTQDADLVLGAWNESPALGTASNTVTISPVLTTAWNIGYGASNNQANIVGYVQQTIAGATGDMVSTCSVSANYIAQQVSVFAAVVAPTPTNTSPPANTPTNTPNITPTRLPSYTSVPGGVPTYTPRPRCGEVGP